MFPFTAPNDSAFAWVNQGGATLTTANGGIFLNGPAAATSNLRIRKKAAPATPYTITAAFLPLFPLRLSGGDVPGFGLVFRQASDGKLVCLEFYLYGTGNSAPTISVDKYTDATTFVASYFTPAPAPSLLAGGVIWLRLADDGTNRKCSYSLDGQNFHEVHAVSRTDFLTADEVGFAVDAFNATYGMGVLLLSWKES
jgi:hypothetical protein